MLSVAYKNVIGARRASWRIISSIEQKEDSKGNEEHVKRIKKYRQEVRGLRCPYGVCHELCMARSLSAACPAPHSIGGASARNAGIACRGWRRERLAARMIAESWTAARDARCARIWLAPGAHRATLAVQRDCGSASLRCRQARGQIPVDSACRSGQTGSFQRGKPSTCS